MARLKKPEPMLVVFLLLTLLAGAVLGYSYLTVDDGALAKTRGGHVGHVEALHALAADPDHPGKVFFAYDDGIGLGPEPDGRWLQITEEHPKATALATDPDDARVIWYGGQPTRTGLEAYPLGVRLSRDGGETAELVAFRGTLFTALAVSPADASVVWAYAPAGGILQRTTDGGDTWSAVTEGLDGVRALAAGPGNASVLYAAADGVHVSRDGGATWTPLDAAPADAVAVAAGGADNATVLYAAGPESGVHESRDGGATWTALGTQPDATPVTALAVGPEGTLFTATRDGHVAAFADGAWTVLREA